MHLEKLGPWEPGGLRQATCGPWGWDTQVARMAHTFLLAVASGEACRTCAVLVVAELNRYIEKTP